MKLVLDEKKYKDILNKIIKYIYQLNIDINGSLFHLSQVKLRNTGKKFSLEEHVRAMIYSFLTNQRPWYSIVPNLESIDKLFYNYNIENILKTNPEIFIEGIFSLKCGNISTRKQMYSLHKNICKMIDIEKKFGSMDKFLLSDTPYQISLLLAKNKEYKLNLMGIALALEYMRNVGINEIKPDVHVRRILSAQRLAVCNEISPSESSTIKAIKYLESCSGIPVVEIDAYLWLFCAKGFGEICTAQPKCNVCPVYNECCFHKNEEG